MLSASQPHGSATNSLSAFAKRSHFMLLNAILRLPFSSQLTPPPSDPPCNAPWFFNRLRRKFCTYYLLTYLTLLTLRWILTYVGFVLSDILQISCLILAWSRPICSKPYPLAAYHRSNLLWLWCTTTNDDAYCWRLSSDKIPERSSGSTSCWWECTHLARHAKQRIKKERFWHFNILN